MVMISQCNTETGDKTLKKWLMNLVGIWHVFIKDEDGKLKREGVWGHYTKTNSFNHTPEFMDRIVDMHHDRHIYICSNRDFFPTVWMDDWEEMK